MSEEDLAWNAALDAAIAKLEERKARTKWASDARLMRLAISDLEGLRRI